MKRQARANDGLRCSGEVPEVLPNHAPDLNEMQHEILAVMRQARIRPELLHAYLRTGLMMTEENLKLLSEKDLEAWNAAITECSINCPNADRKAARIWPKEKTHKPTRRTDRWR